MQQQQKEGQLLHGDQLAEFSRLEAEASAKTSKAKTALDTLATTHQARLTAPNGSLMMALCYTDNCMDFAGASSPLSTSAGTASNAYWASWHSMLGGVAHITDLYIGLRFCCQISRASSMIDFDMPAWKTHQQEHA